MISFRTSTNHQIELKSIPNAHPHQRAVKNQEVCAVDAERPWLEQLCFFTVYDDNNISVQYWRQPIVVPRLGKPEVYKQRTLKFQVSCYQCVKHELEKGLG